MLEEEEDAEKEEEVSKEKLHGSTQRGTPEGQEGRMLRGKRKFFPLQSTGG